MDFAEVKAIADRVLGDNKVTKKEWAELDAAIDADGIFSEAELQLIQDILKMYSRGEIEFEDD
ncbi:hypothetical protein DO97_17785 [Neosynechococcus sphagnicola sy1]|uniref:Uncharacterized protein n=1 Tax=Neosynechococcus sphagnicola sy1 TaxID=1497020 RepID=A0A098TL01_9CYAN|nr:hypothetical protein [Neosynechococcus sphagnicola]KGF71523.1 hypothetical protein DO97_17785 [Neosynechococcus sphagnicola sy1]